MKILVTGGGGYLGSVLVPKLLIRGHSVRVVDIGYFGLGHLNGLQPAVQVVRDDLRRIRAALLSRAFAGQSCRETSKPIELFKAALGRLFLWGQPCLAPVVDGEAQCLQFAASW